VLINGGLWQTEDLDPASASQTLVLSYSLAVSPLLLIPGENQVELILGAEGEVPAGRLYYAATLIANRVPREGVVPALETHERSIGVQREYRLFGGREPTTLFQRGDLVEVRLTLDVPEESWYVVIDDPLPAGFEALNERLGTTSHVAALYEEPAYTWERYGYNRKDVRDERVTFFVTHLESGQRTLTYLMRATSDGSFSALPVQVYPMYEPEVWSRSESTQCQVAAR
jgi:uncharacterized protein YfaS (alpha-2-macroglobulin family)